MRHQVLPHTLPAATINFFFVLGLVAALSFRMLIVFTHTWGELFRPVWYLGTIGYVLFFLYRYKISQKRKKAIEQFALIPKFEKQGHLSREEREVVVYLLTSIRKSREHLNYLFIFVLSFAAIVVDVLLLIFH